MTREMKKLLVALAVLAVAPAVAAQESLTAAKDLYASAAYEDALSTLTRLPFSRADRGIAMDASKASPSSWSEATTGCCLTSS